MESSFHGDEADRVEDCANIVEDVANVIEDDAHIIEDEANARGDGANVRRGRSEVIGGDAHIVGGDADIARYVSDVIGDDTREMHFEAADPWEPPNGIVRDLGRGDVPWNGLGRRSVGFNTIVKTVFKVHVAR